METRDVTSCQLSLPDAVKRAEKKENTARTWINLNDKTPSINSAEDDGIVQNGFVDTHTHVGNREVTVFQVGCPRMSVLFSLTSRVCVFLLA
ncbi:hypothetical protein ABVT39_025685 [Epinephelus coioides]